MTNDFLDIRLPEDLERGASGGPSFNTLINETQSGHEQRNIAWSLPLRKWSFNYGLENRAKYEELNRFFQTVRGRGYGFRFKDWSDFELTLETVGIGDNILTTYQIVKTYDTSSANSLVRPIVKPVAAGFEVYVDDVLQTITTDYVLDSSTGIITFTTPPGVGILVKVTGEFDIPARFLSDELSLELGYYKTGKVNSIGIKELRN